jgi:hypothetical protein
MNVPRSSKWRPTFLIEESLFDPAEVRQQIAKGWESLRQGKIVDGETVIAELLAELDAPYSAAKKG